MSAPQSMDGQRAVVVGFGTSGRASAEALRAAGAKVWVSEARSTKELGEDEADAELGIEIMAGGHRPEHLDGATVVVVSPGVKPDSPVIGWARQRGLPIWGELEVGARLCRVPYIVVTGTNGKSTTSEMIAAMMRAGGLSARACGNIGYPFPSAALEGYDALAVEASSFQLEFQESLRPSVSVLLNLAPDHLDWHGTYDAYASAKARVFAAQGPGDVHVGNAEDAAAARISRTAPCPVRWFRSTLPVGEAEVGIEDGEVVWRRDGEVEKIARPSASGRGFLADAAAAVAAGLAFGLSTDDAAAALRTFSPLPHRGEVVAEVDGIRFVDDSKATNAHAALEALEDVSNAVLIAGGLAKGVDLSPLAAASAKLDGVIAIGRDAQVVERVFRGRAPVTRAGSMYEAVRAAFSLARPGAAVILAPACASQDMFRDYAERGEVFAAAARELAANDLGKSHAH